MEDLELLKVEWDDSVTCGYIATFNQDGKMVRVPLRPLTNEGQFCNCVFGGHTDEILGDRFGADVLFVECICSGFYYNRLLTITDDCGEWGMAWKVLDDTRSSRQKIEEIETL